MPTHNRCDRFIVPVWACRLSEGTVSMRIAKPAEGTTSKAESVFVIALPEVRPPDARWKQG